MIYPERVRQARELCGFTLRTLGERVGVTPPAIAHIESGRNVPSPDTLEAIAKATDVLPTFFQQPPTQEIPEGSLAFRARASLKARERDQAYQYAKLYVEAAQRLSGQLNLPPVLLPKGGRDPVTMARLMRLSLAVATDEPLHNLVNLIERNGVLIFALPIHFEKVDAFSSWATIDRERPFMVLSAGAPGDRLRYSVAHDLGHIVMHRGLRGSLPEMEHEANAFAAELLLPEAPMRRLLVSSLNLTSAARLKLRWGTSMQSIIRRGRDLGIITDRRYHYLFAQMSQRGMRVREPANLDVAVEKPIALRKMTQLLFGPDAEVERFATTMHITFRRAYSLLSEYATRLTPTLSAAALAETEEYRYIGGQQSPS